MKNRRLSTRHTTWTLLTGLLVGLLSMAVVIGAAQAGPASLTASFSQTPTAQEGDTTQKECTECHPDVGDAWTASAHAHAFDDPVFAERWTSLGKPGECLVCHTTGYQTTSNTYTAEGVQCEACHGPAVESHPPAVVPVSADTDYCGSCHPTTLGEWRLTGHATENVGCSDCHNPHSQAALFENPDELCLNCHKQDLGDHKNDLHIQKGIGCVDCHALTMPLAEQPVDGLAPTGHSFVMTATGCVACHTDTLHTGTPLPGYEQGAAAVAAGLPESDQLPGLVAEYTTEADQITGLTHEQQIQALEAALASTRLSTLFQGGIIGLVLGGSTVFFLRRNQRRQEDAAAGLESSADIDDGDAIDQALKSGQVFLGGVVPWIKRQFARITRRSRPTGKK